MLPSDVAGAFKQLWGPHLDAVERKQATAPVGVGGLGPVSAVIELLDQIPQELLTTCPPERYTELVAGMGALRAAVAGWTAQGSSYRLFELPGVGDPLFAVYRALRECQDVAPSPAAATLAFVDHAKLRESLRLDVAETERAIGDGDWKSATVVGGSVVEALLLWALSKLSATELQKATASAVAAGKWRTPPPNDLNDWKLYQLVAVARHAALIEQDTHDQCDLSRDFRNLIHPGVTLRTGQRCDKGTAMAAAAAVAFVTRDLEKKFP